jgi:hypothetical protein
MAPPQSLSCQSSLGFGFIGGLVFARENSPAEQTGQLDVQITRRWDDSWDHMELLPASLNIAGAQAIAKPARRQSPTAETKKVPIVNEQLSSQRLEQLELLERLELIFSKRLERSAAIERLERFERNLAPGTAPLF